MQRIPRATFVRVDNCKVRWPETQGKPVCPHCGGLDAYECRRPNGSLRFRFTFAASFLLACLAALELDGVRLEDL
jgi:hypothetical protein